MDAWKENLQRKSKDAAKVLPKARGSVRTPASIRLDKLMGFCSVSGQL